MLLRLRRALCSEAIVGPLDNPRTGILFTVPAAKA